MPKRNRFAERRLIMKQIRFGVIGLGQRGSGLIKAALLQVPEIEIVTVCDVYPERVKEAQTLIKSRTGKEPCGTQLYADILADKEVDAVLISTAWEYHAEIAIAAMKAGKAVALEVGGAYSENDLWNLVRTQESTQVPFMFMENCCFDRNETMAMNMAKAGKFGTIVHCSGMYGHDLRSEIAGGNVNKHYRLRNYIARNCENYPTHELGPIAQILGINRGNRILTVTSVASKACGMKEYVEANPQSDPSLKNAEFKQGDIVDTILKCSNGETICIKLDTTLPRFYSRAFTVEGTKGRYEQNTNTVFFEGEQKEEFWTPAQSYKQYFNNAEAYEKDYLPDYWKKITPEQLAAGHGGMDYFEFRAFADCYLDGKEMPVDVYDAACWMAVSYLSEQSIACGGAPMTMPDFTCGKWLIRKPL